MKAIGKIIIIVSFFTLLFAGLAFSAGFGNTGGSYSLFYVTGASMEPALPKGSLAVVKKVGTESLNTGDIITFYSQDYNSITTHRIVEMQTVHADGQDEFFFLTSGDANSSSDNSWVATGEIIGRVQNSISYLGYAIAFLQKHTWAAIIFFACFWVVLV